MSDDGNTFEEPDLPEIDPGLKINAIGSGGHTVVLGESMASIAEVSGHFWETIWNDSANAALKETRENPETLFPDDKVTIPPLREKKEVRQTDLIHPFKRKGVPVQITYRAATQDDEPFPDKPYVIRVGRRRYEGTTDDNGELEHWISPVATKGVLTIELDEPGYPKSLVVSLNIGALPPADKLFGVQARLSNLGFEPGEVDGVYGQKTFMAIKKFQAVNDLEVNGVPNESTLSALEEAHGA